MCVIVIAFFSSFSLVAFLYWLSDHLVWIAVLLLFLVFFAVFFSCWFRVLSLLKSFHTLFHVSVFEMNSFSLFSLFIASKKKKNIKRIGWFDFHFVWMAVYVWFFRCFSHFKTMLLTMAPLSYKIFCCCYISFGSNIKYSNLNGARSIVCIVPLFMFLVFACTLYSVHK